MTIDTFKPEARKTAGLTSISARSSKAGQTTRDNKGPPTSAKRISAHRLSGLCG